MDLFKLSAKLTLDSSSYEKGLKTSEKSGSKFANAMKKIGTVSKTALKATGVAIGAAATAITKLSTDAVKAYAEYEQLVGGVETLFGAGGKSLEEYQRTVGISERSTKEAVQQSIADYTNLQNAQSEVIKNAKQAYKTAGVDMNMYMQTVTGFSASLIKSLKGDTVEAARVANRAMVDMADNANKMGTNMESIQNAYQGFAKQNYTMLDNLKLGYGGTQAEMKKLIKDAAKMTDVQKELGVTVDANSMSFANIVNAISVMQKHLGITGTTSKEAATTIQGSIGMMKAAWENLKISFVDPEGNVSEALGNFVESAKTAAKNLVPAISNTLKGIGQAIKDIAPVISAEIPPLFADLLPNVFDGAIALVGAIVQGIVDNLPAIAEAAGKMVDTIVQVFKESDSPVLQFIGDALQTIKDLTAAVILSFSDLPAAIELLKKSDSPVLQAMGAGLESIEGVLQWIYDNAETVAAGIGLIVAAFAVGKVAAFLAALSPIQLIFMAIAAIAPVIIENWGEIEAFFTEMWSAISTAVSDAWKQFTNWTGNIKASVERSWGEIQSYFTGIWESITTAISNAWTAFANWIGDIKGKIDAKWSEIQSYLTDIWTGIGTAIGEAWAKLTEWWGDIKGKISNAWEGVESWLNDNVFSLIGTDFDTVWGTVSQLWGSILDDIKAAWTGVAEWFDTNIGQPISSALQPVVDVINGIINGIGAIFGWNGQTANIGVNINYKNNSPTGNPNAGEYTANQVATGGSGSSDKVKKTSLLNAKGNLSVPYDNYGPVYLHRGEEVLTASQARQGRDGGIDLAAIAQTVAQAVRDGMEGVAVNSYIDGDLVTESVNRRMGTILTARRYAT